MGRAYESQRESLDHRQLDVPVDDRRRDDLPVLRHGGLLVPGAARAGRARALDPALLEPERPSAAVAGDVQVIVTGDKELLAVATYMGIRIESPRTFFEGLEKST